MLMKVVEYLNPNLAAITPTQEAHAIESSFEAHISSEEAKTSCMASKLSLVCRIFVLANAYVQPLAWWEEHHAIFLIVAFLAPHVFGMLGSQIKTKIIFYG